MHFKFPAFGDRPWIPKLSAATDFETALFSSHFLHALPSGCPGDATAATCHQRYAVFVADVVNIGSYGPKKAGNNLMRA
jgi:hypothetical protein